MTNFEWETFKTLLFLFLLFAGLGVPLVLVRFVYRLTLTPDGLVQRNTLGQYKELAWANIQTAEFTMWKEMKLSDGSTKIKCSSQLVGFTTLVAELERRLGKTRGQMGIDIP